MDQIYICKFNNCKKYYETPVILPCRAITCKQHIDKFFIKKDGRDKFECEFCDEIHVIPKNGFNINHSLMNAMECNLHLTGKYRIVMQRLKELESLIADIDLSNLLNDPESYIYDYFQDLRNKIDLQRETLIMEIHKFSDIMISKLELSEKEYKKNYEEKLKFNFKNSKLNEDLNNFDLKKLKQNLRNPNVNDDLLDINLKEINENIEKINLKKNKAKHDLLKGKFIDFQPSVIDIKIFGKFVYANISKFSTDSDPKYLVNFQGHSRSIRKIILMENLNILISASNDQTIKIWNLSNGHCLKTIQAHKRFITGLCLIQDYKLITSSSDFSVKIWNLNDYKCIESFEFLQIVHSICKLSDDSIILGFKTGNIIIWDIINKKIVDNILNAHDSRVTCMKLYDSNRLISGSMDKKIKIWDLSTKKLLNVLNGHGAEINCLEIINNHKLASGSNDRTIKIWDLLTCKLIDTIYMTNSVTSIKDKSEYLIIGLIDAIAIYHLENKCFLKTFGELPAFLNGIELLSNGNIVCYTFYPNFLIKIIKNEMI